MPKILITGNGFDLNLGLPTHYNDFINILNYIVSGKEINYDKIYSQSLNYEKIKTNFNAFDFNQKKIETIKKEINNNLWFDFFKNEFNIETWIDFENKIEYVLTILLSSFENIQKEIFEDKSIINMNSQWNHSIFKNNIETLKILSTLNFFKFTNSKYLVFNENYFIKKYGRFIGPDIGKISKMLSLQLTQFKKIFNLYFEIFVYPFYENSTKEIDKNRYENFDKHYTFNYTNTFEKLYSKNNITDFLHGKIDSIENKIVLGINEIPKSNIDNRYFLNFTKYFQKLNINTDFRFIQEYEKKDRDNYVFFFLGHSMDRSDKDYIIEVFNFVKRLETKQKIIIGYHNTNSKSKLLTNLLDIIGKTDIEMFMRKDILSFLQINSSKFKLELKKETQKIFHPKVQIR